MVFANGRRQGNRKTIAGVWANKNAGNPNSWTYDPDFDKQATDTGTWKQVATRLTFQASMRDRISFYWDEQSVCRLCLGGEGTATSAPEGTPTNQGFPQKHVHATWTAPFTSRWLAETGFGLNTVQWGGVAKEPQDTTDLIRVVEQGGVIPGIAYRSTNWSRPFGYSAMWRGSLSYITGSHSVKFGYEGNYFWNRAMSHTNTQLLEYRFNNGVPNQLTMTLASPIVTQMYERDHSFYAQDQWTRGRLSLQAGFRVEHITSAYPEQRIGRSKFLPQDIVFPAQDSPVNLNDIAPRMGVAYDLFGTGRTALKATLGRYASEPVGERYVAPYNPVTRLVTSNPRGWIDQDRDFVPDCDLLNPAAQSPATTGSVDTCGASNPLFGQNRPATVYDADLITGWNKRFQNWDLSAAVRHELFPRVGIEVEYMRRVFGNFRINDNRAVGPQDFDGYSVVVPTDPRLPLSGQTLTGLYNVKPDKFNLTDNFVTFADNYGKQIRHYDGMSLNVMARPANGVTAQGGFSFGRLLEDNCELASELPELFQPGNGAAVDGAYAANTGVRSTDFCHLTTPLMPQYTGLATYTIPRVLLQVSGTLTSKRLLGVRNTNHNAVFVESLAANLVATNAQIQSSLGRPLSGGQQVVTINLAEPGTLYNDRITTMDFRVARVQRFGNRRLLVGLDVYNIGNSGAVVGYNQTYGPSFLTPTAILQARFAKISAQLDF